MLALTPISLSFPSLLTSLSADADLHPELKLLLRNDAGIDSELDSIDSSSFASDRDGDVDGDGHADVDSDAMLSCASSASISEG